MNTEPWNCVKANPKRCGGSIAQHKKGKHTHPMIRQLKIAREGQELGAWPFDVVFSLLRCGSLVPTDTFWIEGMEEWKPLSEVVPPETVVIWEVWGYGHAFNDSLRCRASICVSGNARSATR
jgi:hypothetical protein